MNRQQIECFIILAEYKNYTDAAQRLYISQPALSRQISSLEQELNVKLLNRNNKEVSLTRAGYIMLENFKKWNSRFDDVLTEAILTEELQKQNIKIAIISGIRLDNLLEIVAEIQGNGETVSILIRRMVHSAIAIGLHRGQFDAAVTFDDPLFDDSNIEVMKMADASFDFVISKKHYLARKNSIDEKDIQQLMIAAQKGVIGSPREIYVNTLKDLKKTFGDKAIPKKLFSYSSMEDVVDFVKSCSGAAIINSQTQTNIDDERFLKIPMVIKRGLVLAWNKNRIQPALTELIREVKNYLK